MLKSKRWGAVLTLLLLAASFKVSAQAVSGSIAGVVQDASGKALPNAAITITDLDRGAVYHIQSTGDGNYVQTHLLAGRYRVKIEAAGFGELTAEASVQVDASTHFDATLNLASVQSSINVTEATPLLTTDRAEIATNLPGKEVQKLPVLDRNITNLITLAPGAITSSFQHATSENPQQGAQVNVNGQTFAANGFLLDGTENESAILGIAVINPDIDSVQDFKISTSNYEAEFGSASGALIQATTQSGTNQLHGTLFEFLRNDLTNAADPFSQINQPIRWNQFGGSVGGKIIKDKLFGFFDYQGTRRRTGGSVVTNVPTVAERSGDLSSSLGDYVCADGSVSGGPCANPATVTTTEGAITAARGGMVFDPNSGNPDGTGRRVFSRNGVVNVLPVSSQAAQLLSFIPLPNNGSDIVNNYISEGSQRFDTNQYNGRVDYNFSGSTHIFGRYTLADFNNFSPAAFGNDAGGPSAFGFSGTSVDRNQSLALGLDHTFNPNLITDMRFGFFRYRIRVQPNDVGTTPAADSGIPGLNTGSVETSGMPAFSINGTGGFNFGYSLGVNQCNCPLRETENHFQWVNNWTKIAGNHIIKFGGDVRRAQQQRIPSDSHRSGELSFNNSGTGSADLDNLASGAASTGSGLGAFLLGNPSSFGRYFTGSDYYPGLRQTRLFFYAQDSWRITPKLTLNYGLRWENYLPQTAAKPGGAGSFDPSTGEVLAAGIGNVPSDLGVKAYNAGFVPRVGIAYQANERTVIRSGYGESFNPGGLGAVFGQGADYNPPIVNPQVLNPVNQYASVFNLANGPAAPVNPPVSSTGRYLLPDGIGVNYFTDPVNSYRIPQVYFWNFTVQRQFTSDLALEVAYVGNVGRHIFVALNRNQAIPGPGDDFNERRPFYQLYGLTQGLYQYCNCDNSSYNGLQTKLTKTFAHGLDFLVTYTYSKALGNSDSGLGGFSDNYNVRGSHGPVSWDRTHVVTIEHNLDLPFGRKRYWTLGNSLLADEILGGWRLSGVHTLSSGLPFTPLAANAPLLNADFNNVRADVVGDPSLSNRSATLWYNPAAFSAPQQAFRNGSAGRNSLRGPNFYNFNFSLSKNLIPSERWSLELRADAFNVFNHVNLGLPNPYVDEQGAGQITNVQAAMRQMQFGLHFRF